jgi:uncharacterized sodium:solute symporter family permease YidK
MLLLDEKMKILREAIVPALLIAGVWLSIWMAYSGALAINNFVRVEGMVFLPPATNWLLFAARYGIMHAAGIALSALAALAALRRSRATQNILSLMLVSVLLFVSLGFGIFMYVIGGCMCDEWRQWERHDHPTTKSTLSSETAPSAAPSEG